MRKYIIGIDPGVNTGFAVKNLETGKLERVESMNVVQAFNEIEKYKRDEIFLIIEDARKWNGYKKGQSERKMKAKAQGAGSVKRDSKLWKEYVDFWDLEAHFISPKEKGKKLDSDLFEKVTGWKYRTNEHARDAAMAIFSLTSRHIELLTNQPKKIGI